MHQIMKFSRRPPFNIPLDVVFIILCQTDIQTMEKCKLVSKNWEQLICSSHFIISYIKVTGNFIGYLDKRQSVLISSFKFESSLNNVWKFPVCYSYIKASSQGILCCMQYVRDTNNYSYYVTKPFINERLILPSPKYPGNCHEDEEIALNVMSSKPFHYKITRISRRNIQTPNGKKKFRSSPIHCQIFDSKNWKWKEINKVPHRLMKQTITYDDVLVIVCLNTETLYKISLPQPLFNNKEGVTEKRISEYEGKLGLIYNSIEGNIELWVLKDWKQKGKWEIAKQFNTNDIIPCKKVQIVDFFNEEIALGSVVIHTYDAWPSLFIWNMKDGKIEVTETSYDKDVLPFSSDWEPVKLKEVLKKKKKIKKSTTRTALNNYFLPKNFFLKNSQYKSRNR